MTPRNANRIQPRDSMYPRGEVPFNLPAANDEPANEPDGLIDSWPFMACFAVIVGCVYVARAFGWLP